MTIPTIHLNGTSKDDLLEQWMGYASALRAAREALTKAQPNGRDYYVQSSDALREALNEHSDRARKIDSLIEEAEAMMEKIADQETNRR